jgi:glutamate N-acetyltransferase/amino-acid N-acetyltransferase
MSTVSLLAPKTFQSLPPIAGVALAAGNCGIRYKDRPDLLLASFPPRTALAGMFTRSTTAGPPVEWCRACLPGGAIRGLVVNAGNANAFTGDGGRRVVRQTAERAATLLGCAAEEVFISSTGVIGEPPPADRIVSALPELFRTLEEDAWDEAARAIMTTDTYPKLATRETEIEGRRIRLNGIAKGSGMLMPNMATMLVYLATDAAVEAGALQDMLSAAVRKSFNCITVDGDTSTSDTILLAATATAGNRPIADPRDPRAQGFRAALDALCLDLSHQVVRDGEGASKFVRITVAGAVSDASASNVAFSIANSPLVKTAIAGCDPNWGRIVMAAGKSFEPIDQAATEIRIGGRLIASAGSRIDDYDEEPVAQHLRGSEIDVDVRIGRGPGMATVWTCDLTHAYIDINASYRS